MRPRTLAHWRKPHPAEPAANQITGLTCCSFMYRSKHTLAPHAELSTNVKCSGKKKNCCHSDYLHFERQLRGETRKCEPPLHHRSNTDDLLLPVTGSQFFFTVFIPGGICHSLFGAKTIERVQDEESSGLLLRDHRRLRMPLTSGHMCPLYVKIVAHTHLVQGFSFNTHNCAEFSLRPDTLCPTEKTI